MYRNPLDHGCERKTQSQQPEYRSFQEGLVMNHFHCCLATPGIAGLLDRFRTQPHQWCGDEYYYRGKYLYRQVPAEGLGKRMYAGKADSAGETGNQCDQDNALFGIRAPGVGNQRKTGFVKASGHHHSDQAPDQVKFAQFGYQRQCDQAEPAQQATAGHQQCALARVDQPPG
ncbi:hypothetical protein MnTg03_01131 [bacterium MnTg03]|nr:hypothetical protein MnTg03_01131 [bacterium MnTg03]